MGEPHIQSFIGCKAVQWTVYQPLCSDPTISNTNLPSPQFCTCPYKYTTCPCSPSRVCFLRVSPCSSATAGPGSGMPAALSTARCHQPPTALPARAFRHQGPGLTPAHRQLLNGQHGTVTELPSSPSEISGFLKATLIAFKISTYPSAALADFECFTNLRNSPKSW